MKLLKIQYLRGFAAIYVVLGHTFEAMNFGQPFKFIFSFGQTAVMLFFLISGMVIHYSYSKNRVSMPIFIYKRIVRIYIPLIIVSIVGFFLLMPESMRNFNKKEFLGTLFMVQDLSFLKPNVIANPFLGNNPLWSLSYEFWFYILYSIFMPFLLKKKMNFNNIFYVSIGAALFYVFYPVFAFRILMYFGIWWSGVVLIDEYLKNENFNGKLIFGFYAIVLAILAANIFIHDGIHNTGGIYPKLEFRHYFASLMLIVVGLQWNKYKWIGFDTLFKKFLFFAPISYTLYICHALLIIKATYLDWINNTILRYILYFIITILFSNLVEVRMYPYIKKRISL